MNNIGNKMITANYCKELVAKRKRLKDSLSVIENGLCDAAREGYHAYEAEMDGLSEDDITTIKNILFKRGFTVGSVKYGILTISF